MPSFLRQAGQHGWLAVRGGVPKLIGQEPPVSFANADLSITAVAQPNPSSERVLRIRLAISNAGPDPATNTLLAPALPSDAITVTFTPELPAAPPSSLTRGFALGTIPSGGTNEITFEITSSASHEMLAAAYVGSAAFDINRANNRIEFRGPIDLSHVPVPSIAVTLEPGTPAANFQFPTVPACFAGVP